MKRIVLYSFLLVSFLLGSCTSYIETKIEGQGTVYPDYSGGDVITFGTGGSLKEFNFTATPNEGWEFVGWDHSDDGRLLSYGLVDGILFTSDLNNYGFYMEPQENHILTAKFRPINSQLEIVVEGEGYAFVDSSEGDQIRTGTSVTLIALPEEGWQFIRWEGVEVTDPSNASINIQVKDNMNIKAIFEKRTVDIIIDAPLKDENLWGVAVAETKDLPFPSDVLLTYSGNSTRSFYDVHVGHFIYLSGFDSDNSNFKKFVLEVELDTESLTLEFDEESGIVTSLSAPEEAEDGGGVFYQIPLTAKSIKLTPVFTEKRVAVPSGGYFDINNFAELMEMLLPALRGGWDNFRTINHINDGVLERSTLDAYHLGEDFNDLYPMTHNYAEEGYIESSSYQEYTWKYKYNNEARVSSIEFETDKGFQSFDLDYIFFDNGNSYISFTFLGEEYLKLADQPTTNARGMYVTVPEKDIQIFKSVSFVEGSEFLAGVVNVKGASGNEDYSLKAEHEYNDDGIRHLTIYNDGEKTSSWSNSIYYSSEGYLESINSGEILKTNVVTADRTLSTTRVSIGTKQTEYRDEYGLPVKREYEYYSGGLGIFERIDFQDISLNVDGSLKEGHFVLLKDDSMLSTREDLGKVMVVNGKAVWYDQNGQEIESSAVSDLKRFVSGISDDNSPTIYFGNWYAYDSFNFRIF